MKYENIKFRGELYVINGDGFVLLGREWLKILDVLPNLCLSQSYN